MNIKVSQEKLDMLKDIVINGIGIEDDNSFEALTKFFQSRTNRLQFLTPNTRRDTIAEYILEPNNIVVYDDKFYDLLSSFIGSRKVYDLVKEDIIRRIFKTFTKRYKAAFPKDPESVDFVKKD